MRSALHKEKNMARYQLQLKIFLVIAITKSIQYDYKIQADKNKALYGYCNISNTTTTNIGQCLQVCLANCLCKSFQICHKTECQLCSSNKYMHPAAMRDNENCSAFNFQLQTENSVNQCGTTCISSPINCCFTSNPCFHGGSCVPLIPHNTQRYTCKCPLHYHGKRCEILECATGYSGKLCEHKIKSCKDVAVYNVSSFPSPGIYTILDHLLKPFKVFCDFRKNNSTSNSTTWSWTLVQTYALYKNFKFLWTSFLENSSTNKKESSWSLYRLGRPRMKSIRGESTKWRITCSYDKTYDVNYSDYVQGSFSEVDLLDFNGEQCVKVDYISVRGQSCRNCTAYAFQKNAIFHFPSQKGDCEFRTTDYKNCPNETNFLKQFESNFGFYGCANPDHLCSANMSATTQTWFGA